MYPISNTAKKLFLDSTRQVADISFYGTESELHLTEKDIVQGGLSVNRYCVSGDRLEIGSVVAGELKLLLDNSDGRFNKVKFEGAELFVRVGVKKWSAARWEKAAYHYIPFGYFTVDEAPRKLKVITLTALDRMMNFDRLVDFSQLTFPTSVQALANKICGICNVELRTDLSTLPNYNYVIKAAPAGDDLTYRQILSWIAEITGTCGFIDWDGKLNLKWYTATDTVLAPKDRFDSDLHEDPIKLTGVQITGDEAEWLAGTADYALNIEGNELIQHDAQAIADNLFGVAGGFSYIPFTAVVKPMPHLYPLDIISFIDKSGKSNTCVITDYTFTMNGNTELEGKGETVTKSGYASRNPLTKREALVLNKMNRKVDEKLSSQEQSLLHLNETIVNSLGLYHSEEKAADGSTVYYYHDAPEKSDSNVIYTFRAGGFAWTNDWNDGNPVWQNGIDRDGNAILRVLSVFKITADEIDVDSLNVKTLYSESGIPCIGEFAGTLQIGGNSTWNYDNVSIYANNNLSISKNYGWLDSLHINTDLKVIEGKGWSLGLSTTPFSSILCNSLCLLDSSNQEVAILETDDNDLVFCPGKSSLLQSWKIGKIGAYWDEAYIKNLILNTYCTISVSTDGKELLFNGKGINDLSGKEVKLGGSATDCIVADTHAFYPKSSPLWSLGTSSYYWPNAYIGSSEVHIGKSATSRVGFFGSTPTTIQYLSTTSKNMNYSSATESNYLIVLNNLIGILTKYGLIG